MSREGMAEARQRRAVTRSGARSVGVLLVVGAVLAAPVVTASAATAAPGSDPYRFVNGGSRPGYWWDRCARIDVGLDLRYAERVGMDPINERARWLSVLSEMGHYTGYRFRAVDVSSRPGRAGPRVVAGPSGVEIVITYGAPSGPAAFRYPRLGGSGVLAYGGAQWWGTQARAGAVVVGADVLFRRFTDAHLAPEWAGVDAVRSVYLHEFAHVLGLDHVGDARQLMYPYLDIDRDDTLGPGDRRALRLLSRAPCHSRGRPAAVGAGDYVPDERIMPLGDAADDPPQLCQPSGPCLAEPEPTPDPGPSPAPTATPAPTASTLPALR